MCVCESLCVCDSKWEEGRLENDRDTQVKHFTNVCVEMCTLECVCWIAGSQWEGSRHLVVGAPIYISSKCRKQYHQQSF